MAAFDRETELTHPPDLVLRRDGPIHLRNSQAKLDETINELQALGYQVKRLDMSKSGFHDHVAEVFDFPDYYGHNLNALDDCLSDVRIPESRTGLLVVLDNAHKAEGEWITTLLPIFEDFSNEAMLFGERILILVHSNDPRHELRRNRHCWAFSLLPPRKKPHA